MEMVWLFETCAVTLERIDFLDPAHQGEPDVRERGVRLEVRPVSTARSGTIYASAATALEPGACRIDLLESRPGAADRMHWHPTMHDGEPGERVFDGDLSADPLGWLADRLLRLDTLVPNASADQIAEVGARAHEIVAEAARGLEWAREPWPDVVHDERGLAVS